MGADDLRASASPLLMAGGSRIPGCGVPPPRKADHDGQAREMGERVASLSDKLNYDGRRVLITGAAGGIGSALARCFAGAGASLALADRNAEGLARLAAELPAGTRTHVFDQGDAASMEALAAEAGPVDVLI